MLSGCKFLHVRLISGLGLLGIILGACGPTEPEKAEEPVRGLRTILVKETAETTVRRYPSVLQPGSITTLSFEIAGRLTEVDLDVGQRVKKGDVLAEIDPKSLEFQVQSAQAALSEAQSRAKNAAGDYKRKKTLLEKKVVTQAVADQSRTEAEATAAQVVQAQRSLDTARENLTKAKLIAPFDGILNSVDVQSYANVSTGSSVVTLYALDVFETSFSVSYDVVNRLAVGKKVKVRLADNPDVVLAGHVSELGARADAVSSFPVVVKLDQTDPSIKAGMAVEISMEFSVPLGKGFSLPVSVLPLDGVIKPRTKPSDVSHTEVFIYDPQTSTVSRKKVSIAGVRKNKIIIVDGLKLGDRVASAGVSFLREGQKVKLLPDAQ
ncbi:MAG: efflux RND transporter periplasmic adaptor subunit [Hyphomicrobiaceae bacterium]